MPRAAEPNIRELQHSFRAREDAEAAEKAVGRLLAGIEAIGTYEPISAARAEALRRHGNTLHRIGGRALVRLTFDRLCTVALERASRRFDLLGRAWGDLLSKGGQP